MMSRFNALSALLLAASLAACAQTSDAPPVSANSNASSQAPQPPNSLPDGSAVNAPLTSQTGTVGETQVAPAPTRASARRSTRRHRRPAAHRRAPAAAPVGTTAQ